MTYSEKSYGEQNSRENSGKGISLILLIAMQIILSAQNRYPEPALELKLFPRFITRALYSVFNSRRTDVRIKS